jgi:hypothetical protein
VNIRLVAVSIAAVSLACGPVTKFANVWRSPEFEPNSMQKILVLAIAGTPMGRRSFEDSFVRELNVHRVDAVQSYTLLPSDDALTEAEVKAVVAGKNFDGVIVSRLKRVEEKTVVVPPRVETVRAPGYYGHYRGGWTSVHTPGYSETLTTVVLDTQLYAVESAEPVWGARSETINPSSVDTAIESVTRALAKRLASDEVVPE